MDKISNEYTFYLTQIFIFSYAIIFLNQIFLIIKIMNQPSQRMRTDYPVLRSKNRKYDIQMSSDLGIGDYEALTPSQEMRFRARVDTKRIVPNSHRSKNFRNLQFDERKSDIVQYTVQPKKQVIPQFSQNHQSDISNVQERYKKINKYLQKEIQNLKEQNEELFIKCKQISKKKEKYKRLYLDSQQQLQLVIEQRQSYKQKADQLMKIVEKDMRVFQKKLKITNQKNQQHEYNSGKDFGESRQQFFENKPTFYQQMQPQENQLDQGQYQGLTKIQTRRYQHHRKDYYPM